MATIGVAARLAVTVACLLSGCVQPLPSKLDVSGKTRSVCELSLNFAAYAGQTVVVRGIYQGGLRQQCPQLCPTGDPWPSVLDLARSDMADRHGVRVPFRTREDSWDALDTADSRARKADRNAEIWATFHGYLVAHSKSPLGPCDRVASGMWGGLYANSWHGAVLVVERVENWEVKSTGNHLSLPK